MFSTPYSLKKRTGKLDTPRGEYLKQLVDEYRAPGTNEEQREQVLANLANFGYDPINYEYFRRFGVLDVFVEQLNESRQNARNNSRVNLKLLCFALGGVCNVCLDPRNKPYLLERDLIDLVAYFLRTPVDGNDSPISIEIVLNCLTCLYFVALEDETVRERVAAYRDENICLGMLVKTTMSASSNKRIANLAQVFVQDLKI